MNKEVMKKISACIIGIGLALYISMNFYQLMMIQGKSMYPTYIPFQIVVVNKQMEKYEKDDVIAFRSEELHSTLVKRVVATPGDRVQIINEKLFVNDIESYFYREYKFAYSGILAEEIELQEGQYIVVGDNIEDSIDSRYEQIGVVDEENIIGRVK